MITGVGYRMQRYDRCRALFEGFERLGIKRRYEIEQQIKAKLQKD